MRKSFDPIAFFAEASSVAAAAEPGDVFRLLKRSLSLPADFCALVRHVSGDQLLCEPNTTLQSEDVAELLFVRVSAVSVDLSAESLTSSDKYLCDVSVSLQLCVPAERGDLESFRDRVMGSNRRITTAGLGRYVQPTVAGALRDFVGRHAIADLIDGQRLAECVAAVEKALQGPCFAGGLTLEAKPRISVASSAYSELRRVQEQATKKLGQHEAERELRAAIATAQDEKLAHLETMLGKLKELADASPDVGLPELMRTFDESQRGQLYQALFQSRPPEPATRWVAVASGHDVLFFDPRAVDKPARTVSVEGDAGGLRSVLLGPAETGGRPPTLLLGAACGVYEMGIDAAGPEKIYLAQPREQTRGGFNAVAANDDWIVASHSEQGLIAWRRGDPQEPIGLIPKLTASAGAVRNAQFARGRLWCSVDDRLVSLPADDLNAAPKVVSGGRSAIAALCVTGDGVYAGNADGEVLFWKDTDRPTVLHAGSRRAAESVNVLPTGGIVRLFYTDTSLAVYSRVVGDTFTCRYEAGGQTIRRAETAPDLIAGTNDLRDRVIIWTPNTPAQPTAVIPLARLTGRSVQDVCLVPIT